MANVKISELAVNSSPSASATLAGVDGGETVQIPITEFVTKDDNGNVKIREGSKLTFYNKDESRYCVLECEDGTLSLNGNTVATKDDIPSDSNFVTKDEDGNVTVAGNMTVSEDITVDGGITTNSGDITSNGAVNIKSGNALYMYSDDNTKKVEMYCDDDGKLCLNGKAIATVDDIPSGGSIGDTIRGIKEIEFDNQSGNIRVDEDGLEVMSQYELRLNGSLGIEVESTGHIGIISSTEGISINSKNTTIDGVSSIKTINEGIGQAGQVLTTNGETVYWGNASGGGSPMTSITYAELRALRDAGNLIPGMFYRITDYECTTAQENTRAMNHRFYIIVQALSHDTLSETAKADLVTDGTDDYFVDAGANVSAWELKYCLDNDTTRFAWACDTSRIYTDDEFWFTNTGTLEYEGTTYYKWTAGNTDDTVLSTTLDINVGDSLHYIVCPSDGEPYGFELDYSVVLEKQGGKGVIYYMKDEHGNECPYDFKNIQFKRMVSLEDGFPKYAEGYGEETWVYTFCGNSYHNVNAEWSELKDGSLESPYMHQSDEYHFTFTNNIMKPYYRIYDMDNEDSATCGKQYLNDNVFFGWWTEVGSESPDEEYIYHYPYCCAFINLDYNCYNNTFGDSSKNIKVGANCYNNYIQGGFIEIGNECSGNSILGSPYLKMGNQCTSNNIIDAPSTTLGDGCCGNDLNGHHLILLNDICGLDTTGEYPSHKIYKGDYEIV